jgi:hypothetical protein
MIRFARSEILATSLLLLPSTSVFAMGKKPSPNVQTWTSKFQVSRGAVIEKLAALRNGELAVGTDSGAYLLDASGNLIRQMAKTSDSVNHLLQLSDGTIVASDRSGFIYLFTEQGDAKTAPFSAWAEAGPKDRFDEVTLAQDDTGTTLAVAVGGLHNRSDIPNVIETEGEGFLKTFDSSGKLRGSVELDAEPARLQALNDGTFYVETRAGTVMRVNTDASVKSQLAFPDPRITYKKQSDIHCASVFPDGALGVVLWDQSKIVFYGADWSKEQSAYTPPKGMHVDLAGCAVTSKGLMIAYIGSADPDSKQGTSALFFNEKGETLQTLTFNGQVAKTMAYKDGSFSIAYNPWTFDGGVMLIPGLPIPIPVGTTHARADKNNFVFFDENGKQISSFSPGRGTPNEPFLDSGVKVGDDVVLSNGSNGIFVDTRTGQAAGSFPGMRDVISAGLILKDGTVINPTDKGTILYARLKN